MTVFSDPLAANLALIGTMFFGLAAFVVYRFFLGKDKEEVNQSFSYFLLGTGFYALIYGLFYSMLWPEPEGGSYSILFGDPLALFGLATLLAGAIIIKKGSLSFAGFFGFFAGIYSIVSGYEGYLLKMTQSPIAMFLLYLGAGVSGILVLPLVLTKNKWIAVLTAIVLVLTGIVAFVIGIPAVGEHLSGFAHAP